LREEWVEKDLHLTKAIRVHFSFPYAKSSVPSQVSVFRETTVDGSSAIYIEKPIDTRSGGKWEERNQQFLSKENGEQDLVVNIDQTNIHQWFREKTKELVPLLQEVTGVWENWNLG
jgi:hypothetical protein